MSETSIAKPSSHGATVYQLSDYRRPSGADRDSGAITQFVDTGATQGVGGIRPAVTQPLEPLDLGDLYPALSDGSRLSLVLGLLDRALEQIQTALLYFDEGDYVGSDAVVMYLVSTLVELYCLRAMGDGFGNVVDSLLVSIREREGVALERHQLTAVCRVLDALRLKPFMSFEDSMELVDVLEDANLEIAEEALDALVYTHR